MTMKAPGKNALSSELMAWLIDRLHEGRGEPLLQYLTKMVFWADVTPSADEVAIIGVGLHPFGRFEGKSAMAMESASLSSAATVRADTG